MTQPLKPGGLTGRCYCGAVALSFSAPPEKVSYCHCTDCRRITGAPVAAFAAFNIEQVRISPDPGPGVQTTAGVKRWFCSTCGSPLAATFDYLPGQNVPVGILDFTADLTPQIHSHAASALPWLHIADDLPRHDSSARAALKTAEDRET